jgi:8-oxo-dGTP diphosphatase
LEIFGVAVKAAILKDDKLLLLFKSALESALDPVDAWEFDLPGGRVEFGEHPSDRLIREVTEETGLHIDIIRIGAADRYSKAAQRLVVSV